MLCLFPLLLLAAAPIPKSTYEGQIAVVLRGQKSELVLVNPSGGEVKRVPLDGIANPYTVKLARGSGAALITTTGNQIVRIGNRNFSGSSGYLFKLDGSEKPKELFERKAQMKWVLNRDATIAYGGELDEEKMANAPQNEMPSKAWRLDLKTLKSTPIPLPTDHWLIDISHDDKTVLLQTRVDGKYRTAIAPTDTWKPTLITESSDYPHGFSPDGKKVFLMEYNSVEGRGANRMVVLDLDSRERRLIAQPEGVQSISAYSYGADGKRIAFVGYSQDRVGNNITLIYRLYVCQIDGSSRKVVFETKPGESISDVDWR